MLAKEVDFIRSVVVESGNSIRQRLKIPVRCPLQKMLVLTSDFDHMKACIRFRDDILEELNVKQVTVATPEEIELYDEDAYEWNEKYGVRIGLTFAINSLLLNEWKFRELCRQVNILRKEQKLKITDKIYLTVGSEDKEFVQYCGDQYDLLKRETGADYIDFALVGEAYTLAKRFSVQINIEKALI